ncbi:MAG: hypothetical protein R3A46_21615 [Thermomicrobiales bacterium]
MRALLRMRSFVIVSVLVAATLLLSSCVSMELESEFNEDGGATHTMELTINMEDLNQLGDLGEGGGEIDPFENFDEVEQEAAELGYRVERIEDGDIVGVRLIQDVDDSSNLGDQLNGMFNAGATEGETVSPFSGTFEKDGDDYTLNLTVDGSQLTDTAGEGLGESEDLPIGLDTLFDFTYTARLPGEIDEDETNGRVSDDGSVTWDLPLEGSQTLTAASSAGGDGSNLLLILVVVGIIVLGLIALAAVAFFIFMNRRGSSPAAATATGPTTPPPPTTTYDHDQPTQPGFPTSENADDQSRRDNPPTSY